MIPRILIIDDLFGRTHKDRINEERESLCGSYLLEDITGDEEGKGACQKIRKPVAQAVFHRGQTPACATIGDTVENDLEGTLRLIAEGWDKPPYWSLVLLDLCFYTGKVTEKSSSKTLGMPYGSSSDDDPQQYFGLKILSSIKEKFPHLPVVILSSKPEKEIGLDYSRLGALGFIPRADENGLELLKEHLYRNALIPDEFAEIIGNSKALLYALREVRRSAAHGGKRNILLRGETGTGKRLFARYAHRQRAKGGTDIPYYVVNCPQITPERFASELFGHKKGAFTGAYEDKQGILDKANGGDVLLDEIADLPQAVQAGILKVIDERKYTRLGETILRSVDVRFLSSTNSTLISFREDLLMRLTEAGTINLPPLRDRKDDIPILVEKFVREAEGAHARVRKVEDETILKLQRYSWPGNVRELENCIHTAVQQYSQVPYLVPEHIQLPVQYFESYAGSLVPAEKSLHAASTIVAPSGSIAPGEVSTVPANQANPEQITLETGRFEESKLPAILAACNRTVCNYICEALESNKNKKKNKPSYPETWFAMTGEDVKSSSVCQRNIGNYIFQLSDDDIVNLMNKSKVFEWAAFQCGDKVDSAKNNRLPGLLQQRGFTENPYVEKKEPKKPRGK
ncbi:MAG: sigma 54-interacting transcriptional regulator [Syntrophales bacterium]|nr:sigma 54-interacting transcriptional regulator [Syntrophales bacterium]